MLLCRYTSKILLQKIIKEILIQNELLIQSQLHLKFEEKKVYYFFGRKYYFFQLQISHLTSINLLDLQSKTIVFCAKYLTNFSPIQYVYNVKSPFVVEKINLYLFKNSFVFTSRGPRIFGFISSAAHFSNHFKGLTTNYCTTSLSVTFDKFAS